MPSLQRGTPDLSWDSELDALGGSFLQSAPWMRFQEQLGRDTYYASDGEWMWSGFVQPAGPFRYLYLPYGPTAAHVRAAAHAIASAMSAGRDLGCDFVRVEPLVLGAGTPPPGVRKVRDRQPADTWRLKLDADEPELRKGLTKGHKGSINSAERKGIVLSRSAEGGDIEEFLRLLKLTEQRAEIMTHDAEYFRAMVAALWPDHLSIYFAKVDGQAVAGALGFHMGGTTYYAHAGADPEHRQLSAAAPLVWKMILDAKQRGGTWFDFWGITTSSDPTHPWAGFTQFKRAFGGEEQHRAGTWDIPLRRFRYGAFSAAQAARRMVSR